MKKGYTHNINKEGKADDDDDDVSLKKRNVSK